MRLLSLTAAAITLAASVAALAQGPTYHQGRTPTEAEIKAWDIAISPDGHELPTGSGTAKDGAAIYKQKCAVCHGPEGVNGPTRALVGKLTGERPVRTVWSWAYATTIWDYINRAMPFNRGTTLTADEVYALTAYLLYRNDLIKEADVIDAKTLPKVEMPYRSNYYPANPAWKPGTKNPNGYYPSH